MRKKHMHIKEPNLLPTEQKLMAMRDDLSTDAAQAWSFSVSYIAGYLNEHVGQTTEVDEHEKEANSSVASEDKSAEMAALMAAGRLEWLLRETRPTLTGRLSERDILYLLDCYQGQICSPDNFDCLASDLCDHFGIEFEDYRTSQISTLVDKLLNLNPLQRLTLADALEQTWHRGLKCENKTPKEFLVTLGIDLA